MASALTGVQRFQPSLATRPVSLPASAAAALRATALARVPPNQADRPRSCRERARVLRATDELLRSSDGVTSYPSAPVSRGPAPDRPRSTRPGLAQTAVP